MLNDLKKWFGERCSGVRVNGEIMDCINIPSKQLKFCEAVNYSFNVPLLINNDNLGCPGARRTVGFVNQSNELAKKISENTKIPHSYLFVGMYLQEVIMMERLVFHLDVRIQGNLEE